MDRAKEIIATFLKVEPSEINNNTVIDSSAIAGSVLLHRMYSSLSKEGYHVVDYRDIKTFGDFVDKLNGTKSSKEINHQSKKVLQESSLNGVNIGIDIEDIINMPVSNDYREDKFYIDNFSKKEISYCILQADPRASFAGKFALKEAIIKADNSYINTPFKEIEILNTKDGKPYFNNFNLSVSHSTNEAVGVAIRVNIPKEKVYKKSEDNIKQSSLDSSSTKCSKTLSYLSLILSTIAIALVIYQNF